MKTCLLAVLVLVLLPSTGAFGTEIIVPVSEYAAVDKAGHAELLMSFESIDSVEATRILRAECVLSIELDTLCEEWLELIASPILSQWSAATIQSSLSSDTSSLQSSASGSWLFSVHKGGAESITIPVTEIVRGWCSGQKASRGIAIKLADEFSECGFTPVARNSGSVGTAGYLVVRLAPQETTER